MTRTTKHFFGTLTAVLMAVSLAALILVAIATSAAEAQSSEEEQSSKEEQSSEGLQPAQAENSVTNPLKFVMANSTADNGKSGTYKAVAQCPDFYQAISGGFDLHRPISKWSIRASRPATPEEAGSETAWVVEAMKAGSAKFAPFTAYAVCAPESLVPRGVDSLYHTSSNGSLPSYWEVELTPPCAATDMAIGGGFAFVGSEPWLIDLTRSQPNPGGRFGSWIIKLENHDTGVPKRPAQDVRGYSVCIRRDLVKDLAFQQDTEWGKNVINSNTSRCPENTYLLSGGAGTSNDNSNNILWSHIRPGGGSEADPPKTWSAGAEDFRIFQVSKIPLTAHAMCGRFADQPGGGGGKLSGKNRGWGDGEGGGRAKEEDASGGR